MQRPETETYQDEHRIFVQGIMCKGILNERGVNSLHEKALSRCNIKIPEKKSEQNALLLKNIQIINAELRKVGLLIKKSQDEDKGKSFFLLANIQSRMNGTSRDLATTVQSQWSLQELDYLRLIATEILESEKKAISSTEALRLTDKVNKKGLKRMSMEAAEDTINRLVTAKWLKVLGGKLVLDVRFLGEMEGWMVEVMGRENILSCKTCRKVVVRGGSCPCRPDHVWHFYCLARQAKKGAAIKCEVCNKEIPLEVGLGQQGEDEEEEEEFSQRPGAKSSRRSGRKHEMAGEEDEYSQRPGSRRKSRKHQEEVEEMDVDEDSPEPEPSRGEPSKRSRRRSGRSMMEMEAEEEQPSQVRRSRIKKRFSGDSDSD